MLRFGWKVAVVVAILVATVAAIEAVTQDKGVLLLVGSLVGAIVAGALWPVELGLKAAAGTAEHPRRDRRDHAPHH